VDLPEDGYPASHFREAYARIRELERALGRKTMEVEILRAAQEIVKNSVWSAPTAELARSCVCPSPWVALYGETLARDE
jgi:hypothetical protein